MNIFSISSFVAFLICELLASFVYFKNKGDKVNRAFALVTFLVGIWTLFPFVTALISDKSQALFFARIVYIAAIIAPPAFLRFVSTLIDLPDVRKEKKTLLFFYLFSIVFLIFSFSPLFIKNIAQKDLVNVIVPGPVYHVYFLFFAGTIALGYYEIIKTLRQVRGHKRNQLIYTLVAFAMAGLGGLMHFLSAYGVREIFPHDILIVIFTTIISYAVVKYRAMDVNVVFKRTMVYSLSAGFLTGFFVVLVLAITNLFSQFAHVDSFKISIIAALIIALLFNPLRLRVQNFIDKLFYKKTYDYFGTIRKVSHDLAAMFDFKKIYSFVGDIIFSTLGLKNIYLLSAVPNGDYEVVYHKSYGKRENKSEKKNDVREYSPKIDRNSQMFKLLRNSDDIVILDELPAIVEIIGQDTINNVTSNLIPFDGEAVVPVFVDDKLELIFILGEKLSGDIYTDEDIKLLNTISHQTSIAVKNARLYAEKLSSEKFASMGMMSATFAHEIRNPLTSIKTFAQLIPEKYTDTEFRETFSKIVIDEIGRIDGLIKELLSFSSKEAIPREQDLDITALMDDSLENLKGRLELEKRNINVEKIYKKDKINISGDLKRLKQAFVNIVNNGCQAMDENGILKVNILPNGKFVNVIIADTGKGISPQEIIKIFDPFYTTRPMGVGLGLAISKKIIEDHGGRIEVESKLSEGTTFTISLPIGKN